MPTILHFEDDQMILDMYATKFKEAGFEYAPYESPAPDPVEIALKEKPDLIIMSVIMPGMDGFSATKALKADERTKSIPIIGLTTCGQDGDVKKGLELGMKEYWRKADFTPTHVIEKVKRVLTDRRDK